MPYLQSDGHPIPLLPGENDIGNGEGARIRVVSAPAARAAVVALAPDGSAVIRRVGDAVVHVNGVALGVEPMPLLHGDKVEVGESALTFGDDRKAGNTAFVQSVRMPQAGAAAPAAPPVSAAAVPASRAVAGRLVSLVDGREYAVPAHGLVIGRDPTCDVVVASDEVSRKHATVAAGPDGYVLTDSSANGVLVNGERVAARRRLARGDVVVVGREEFRFYADPAAAPAPARAPAPAAPAPSRAPAVPAPAVAAMPAAATPAAAAAPAPAPAPVAPRPPLATLEVVSTGLLHGRVFPIHTPLAHVGRGAHNDVVLAEESVSDSHAKLQKRDAGWFVVDMGSTNGTYVGGRRVDGEAALVGAPDLRVGGVKFIFRGAADAADGAGHTRAIAAMGGGARAGGVAQAERARPAPARAAPEPAPAPRGVPVLWVVIAVVVVIVLILLLKGR